MPSVGGPSIHNIDKVAHFIEYGLFSILWVLSFGQKVPLAWSARMSCLVLAFCYGATIEGIQYLLPWRSAEFADALMNLLGAIAGWFFIENVLIFRNKRQIEHS